MTITPDLPLAELGLDSLDQAELFLALEGAAGQELDADSIADARVVGDLATLRSIHSDAQSA